MPADHRELGGRAARLGDLDLDFVRRLAPSCRLEASRYGGRRPACVTSAGASAGAGSSSIQNRTPSGRIELNADRPGIRDVDLALEIEDLAAGLRGQLVERQ